VVSAQNHTTGIPIRGSKFSLLHLLRLSIHRHQAGPDPANIWSSGMVLPRTAVMVLVWSDSSPGFATSSPCVNAASIPATWAAAFLEETIAATLQWSSSCRAVRLFIVFYDGRVPVASVMSCSI
jgi:hypothetical protein